MLKTISICTALLTVVLIPQVFATTYEVDVTQNGFELSYLEINSGDVVKFINTDLRDYGSVQELEPHCVSDPFAQPYTVESCWIIDGSTPSRSYTLTESQLFYDRFFSVAPIEIAIEASTNSSVDTSIDSAPTNTSEINELTLQAELTSVISQLTDALSTISTLQSQVESKNLEIQTLQSQVIDITPYTTEITSLTTERDQWKQTAENWYAVAMEQLQVMINVLGL